MSEPTARIPVSEAKERKFDARREGKWEAVRIWEGIERRARRQGPLQESEVEQPESSSA